MEERHTTHHTWFVCAEETERGEEVIRAITGGLDDVEWRDGTEAGDTGDAVERGVPEWMGLGRPGIVRYGAKTSSWGDEAIRSGPEVLWWGRAEDSYRKLAFGLRSSG